MTLGTILVLKAHWEILCRKKAARWSRAIPGGRQNTLFSQEKEDYFTMLFRKNQYKRRHLSYGNTAQFGKKPQPEFLAQFKVWKTKEYCMYPQGVCRIRKPAYAGNGCAIFLVFQTGEVGQKDGCGSQTQLRGVALTFLICCCRGTLRSSFTYPKRNAHNGYISKKAADSTNKSRFLPLKYQIGSKTDPFP